jgi:predicted MFS family arabinose efflux permease
VMMAGFILIPNMAAFMQLNMGVHLHELKYLYFAGGIASLISLQISGQLVDKLGAFQVGTVGSVLVAAVVWSVFWPGNFFVPPIAFVVLFMVTMGVRNVAYTTLTTRVPAPAERARFQSLQSAVQHAASAAGAFISARMLTRVDLPAHGHLPARPGLAGMQWVVLVVLALTAVIPLLMWRVQRSVVAREGAPAR